MLESIHKDDKETLWICKPHNGYGGRGVIAMRSSSKDFRDQIKKGGTTLEEKKRAGTVIQRYISNPMLVGGYKFHMRIYVVTNPTCFCYMMIDDVNLPSLGLESWFNH